jgi:hypothetical protein
VMKAHIIVAERTASSNEKTASLQKQLEPPLAPLRAQRWQK